jgi:hypothetical protein
MGFVNIVRMDINGVTEVPLSEATPDERFTLEWYFILNGESVSVSAYGSALTPCECCGNDGAQRNDKLSNGVFCIACGDMCRRFPC